MPRFYKKKDQREFPAWYYRVVGIAFDRGRDVYSEDFDEDLSDLEVGSTCSEEEEEEISRGFDDEDESEKSEDAISERSFSGSDADYYYELKEEREYRKRELRKEKTEAYVFDKSKEVEVQSAHDAMKLEKTSPVDLQLFDPNISNHFRIYSTDWVQHCFSSSVHASPYVEFYQLGENQSRPSSEQGTRQIQGHIYIHGSLDCDFKPFHPPQHSSLEEIELQSDDDKYEITVQFFSHDYLKLKVSQGFFFQDTPLSPKAPDFFEFVGIRRNREKERLEREREAKKRKRSPSPRDSWFERTHPMGSWR